MSTAHAQLLRTAVELASLSNDRRSVLLGAQVYARQSATARERSLKPFTDFQQPSLPWRVLFDLIRQFSSSQQKLLQTEIIRTFRNAERFSGPLNVCAFFARR